MNDRSWTRWAAIAGIFFVVLLIGGLVLNTDFPEPSASDEEIASYLDDSGAHARTIIGQYLWVVAGVSFLGFLSHLRTTLRRAEGESGTLSTLGFAAGLVFTAMGLVSAAAIATVAGGIELEDASKPHPDFVRYLTQLGYGVLLIGGGFAAIVLVLTTSILTLRTGVFPKWLAWLGFLAAVALLLAPFAFFPVIALPIWVLAVSAVLLLRPVGAAAT